MLRKKRQGELLIAGTSTFCRKASETLVDSPFFTYSFVDLRPGTPVLRPTAVPPLILIVDWILLKPDPRHPETRFKEPIPRNRTAVVVPEYTDGVGRFLFEDSPGALFGYDVLSFPHLVDGICLRMLDGFTITIPPRAESSELGLADSEWEALQFVALEYSNGETSRIIGCTEGALHSRLHRARQKIGAEYPSQTLGTSVRLNIVDIMKKDPGKKHAC